MALELPDLERERAKVRAWAALVKSVWRYIGFAFMGIALALAINPKLPADVPFVLPESRLFWVAVAVSGFLFSSIALASKLVKDNDAVWKTAKLELVEALIRKWPLDRSVIIYRLSAPHVTVNGDVTVNLRAVNCSPFAVALHSPTFVPFSGLVGADEPSIRALPMQARLESCGGTVDITVTGRFTSEMDPPLERDLEGVTKERTLVRIFMRGHITATRQGDQTEAKIRLLTDESHGDWVQTVEVAR